MLSASWRWLMTEQSFKIWDCAWGVCECRSAWVCQCVCAEVWNLLPDYLWNYIHRYSLGLYWNLQLHAHDHNWLSLIAKNKFCGCCFHLQLQWNCFSPMGCICAFNGFLFHIKCLKSKQTWAKFPLQFAFPDSWLIYPYLTCMWL